MSALGPELADHVLSAARQQAEEIAASLGRALGWEFQVVVNQECTPIDFQSVPATWSGPGLWGLISSPAGCAALLFPAESGVVPSWCAQPDDSGRSRLQTLVQELGMLLLPESQTAVQFTMRWATDLAATVRELGLEPQARSLPLEVLRGEQAGTLWFAWPLKASASSTVGQGPTQGDEPPSSATATPPKKQPERIVYERVEDALPYLPVYSRSLLRIKTPVRVTLASTRLPVRQILELAPGSLIQFPKACDEPLDLEVGQRRVALGEAVKIGEKFGLRITAIVLPTERFAPVGPRRSAG